MWRYLDGIVKHTRKDKIQRRTSGNASARRTFDCHINLANLCPYEGFLNVYAYGTGCIMIRTSGLQKEHMCTICADGQAAIEFYNESSILYPLGR